MKNTKITIKPPPSAKMASPTKGFLIDHNKFSDVRPPKARGVTKSQTTPPVKPLY